MWLLESELFGGRKLWLRPGKLYLFGRTGAEPGQLVVFDKTISRKHLTVHVAPVQEGGGRNLNSRSKVTIHDLDSKKGTQLNGVQIRGQEKVLLEDKNEVQLGMCSKLLHIRWQPVVLSFSFTSKELRADPWARLRDDLEQLDIKYSAEYEAGTTHVVSKKRNTSKGLQALINGKYVVTDSFIRAVVDAAMLPSSPEEGYSCPLEEDFEGAWPNPLDHLPPRGEETVDEPPAAYAPDERRKEIFDGYTFVFYEKKQHENLIAAITAGKGKALLREVIPGETDVDDFIRYVKGVAGEKGLGSFEDGGEGKGVVVVRYVPKEGNYEWFAQFLTTFAQRLDHRPIDQREFIKAIVACDASMLRRPLEEASQAEPSSARFEQVQSGPVEAMEVDRPAAPQQSVAEGESMTTATARRGRGRRVGASRFKGFDLDDEPVPIEQVAPSFEAPKSPEPPAVVQPSQDSMFVSQYQDLENAQHEELHESLPVRRPQRKRPLSPLPDYDTVAMLDEIAPAAAAVKRRRIARGEPALPPHEPEPEPAAEENQEMVTESPQKKGKKSQGKGGRGKGKKETQEDGILQIARKHREEADAKAAAERRALEELDDCDIDYAAIRKLHIIEECEVRLPASARGGNRRTRDQDIAEGRWDPKWNGRKNFKQFRKHGAPAGRQAPRKIIGLEAVKPNTHGIGDAYWLEAQESNKTNEDQSSHTQPQQSGITQTGGSVPDSGRARSSATRRTVLAVDSSDEDATIDPVERQRVVPEPEPARSRAAKGAERANNVRRSQAQTQTQSQAVAVGSKRAAPAVERGAAKKPRRGFVPPSNDDDEESEDELKFRFGRRR
ncbi:hypothetical protein QBC42DRAFT_110797 [Cladorrhinum samala]|uniref:FHA domain-containing protein n=1 Tax=Cladorrhinum samala TaxID=585594 RepID=A0AAV9HL08_9PEZI|nr:hypothetical protein QBC42DRAFT_110797 [Cladorrhinum samala]